MQVMISATIIMTTHYPGRFYADPAASVFVSFMIMLTSIPLIKSAGAILLESAPTELNVEVGGRHCSIDSWVLTRVSRMSSKIFCQLKE
jgi:Co/Zn/Cd efflux system component